MLWVHAVSGAIPPFSAAFATNRGCQTSTYFDHRRPPLPVYTPVSTPSPPSLAVGEGAVAAAVIRELLKTIPHISVVFTGVTVSADRWRLSADLPARVAVQFAPVDTPSAVSRFLRHWRPAAALFAESELWPNALSLAAEQGAALVLVNARAPPTHPRSLACTHARMHLRPHAAAALVHRRPVLMSRFQLFCCAVYTST